MKQEEAAKDNALAEASAMTKTEAANLAWAKEDKRRANFISGVQRNHLGTFGVFMFVDVHMANMDALYFRGLLLYLFFLCIFGICCSWLPGP